MIKCYDELILIPDYEERLRYLKLDGSVGAETFGCERYLNQALYTSNDWRRFRRRIILRDLGRDLAMPGYEIGDSEKIIIHHINPVRVDDIKNKASMIFDENNVVCVSYQSHQYIHYGIETNRRPLFYDRTPYDTCPWKNV